MREFFAAAFPLIVVGLCVAILAVQAGRKGSKGKDGEKRETCMIEGMCVGMCVGMCCEANLGFPGMDTPGTGICIGMLVGEVIGMMISKEEQEK